MISSAEGIKAAAAAGTANPWYFSPGTVGGFSSRLSETIYPVRNGAVFVTSERDTDGLAWDGKRRYTIRFINDGGKIRNLSAEGQYATWSGAHQGVERYLNIVCFRCGDPAGNDCRTEGIDVCCSSCWGEG